MEKDAVDTPLGHGRRSRSGREIVALPEYRSWVGRACRSQWHSLDAEMVRDFARLTGDDAPIHVDPVAAATSRFGGCIAHGLLLVALLPRLMREAVPLVSGTTMGANYGYDRIRFLDPVPVDSRICCVLTLSAIEEKRPGFLIFRYEFTVEREGAGKPAAAGSWSIGRWMVATDAQ